MTEAINLIRGEFRCAVLKRWPFLFHEVMQVFDYACAAALKQWNERPEKERMKKPERKNEVTK